jgi:nickel-type superoxide dismutase maturation protease
MAPTLRHGDVLLVWLRHSRRLPRAGRIVLVALPERPLSVKRLVARNPDGSVLVAGDNPLASTDSRQLGALPGDAVRGVVVCRLPRRRGGMSRGD